jgi:hypothetical protein
MTFGFYPDHHWTYAIVQQDASTQSSPYAVFKFILYSLRSIIIVAQLIQSCNKSTTLIMDRTKYIFVMILFHLYKCQHLLLKKNTINSLPFI